MRLVVLLCYNLANFSVRAISGFKGVTICLPHSTRNLLSSYLALASSFFWWPYSTMIASSLGKLIYKNKACTSGLHDAQHGSLTLVV